MGSKFLKEATKVAAVASATALGGPVGGAVAAGAVYNKEIRKVIKPKMPDMPTATPEDPVAIPETGGDPLDSLRRRRRKGRASTIQAGSLIPEDVGTKSLLG